MFRLHVVCSIMTDHASSMANEEEQVVSGWLTGRKHKGNWQNNGFDGRRAAEVYMMSIEGRLYIHSKS